MNYILYSIIIGWVCVCIVSYPYLFYSTCIHIICHVLINCSCFPIHTFIERMFTAFESLFKDKTRHILYQSSLNYSSHHSQPFDRIWDDTRQATWDHLTYYLYTCMIKTLYDSSNNECLAVYTGECIFVFLVYSLMKNILGIFITAFTFVLAQQRDTIIVIIFPNKDYQDDKK